MGSSPIRVATLFVRSKSIVGVGRTRNSLREFCESDSHKSARRFTPSDLARYFRLGSSVGRAGD